MSDAEYARQAEQIDAEVTDDEPALTDEECEALAEPDDLADEGQRGAVSSADKPLGSHGRTVTRVRRPVTCGNAGGRYWDRTSDPCRVKAVLSR